MFGITALGARCLESVEEADGDHKGVGTRMPELLTTPLPSHSPTLAQRMRSVALRSTAPVLAAGQPVLEAYKSVWLAESAGSAACDMLCVVLGITAKMVSL